MSNFVNLLDIVYPVGSVYITFNNVSPAESVVVLGKRLTVSSYNLQAKPIALIPRVDIQVQLN